MLPLLDKLVLLSFPCQIMDSLQLSRQLQRLGDRRKPLRLHYLSGKGHFLRVSNMKCTDQKSGRHYTMCLCLCANTRVRYAVGCGCLGGEVTISLSNLKPQCQNTNIANTAKALLQHKATQSSHDSWRSLFSIDICSNDSFQYLYLGKQTIIPRKRWGRSLNSINYVVQDTFTTTTLWKAIIGII